MNGRDKLTGEIIGAAIDIHRSLGPGLLESTYEECMAYELTERGLEFQRQLALPIHYKGRQLNAGYRVDLLVNRQIIVELKSVQTIEPVHEAQLLTYLKLANIQCGLLLNFNVSMMKLGVRRLLND